MVLSQHTGCPHDALECVYQKCSSSIAELSPWTLVEMLAGAKVDCLRKNVIQNGFSKFS